MYYRINLKPLVKIELKILSFEFVYWTYESAYGHLNADRIRTLSYCLTE